MTSLGVPIWCVWQAVCTLHRFLQACARALPNPSREAWVEPLPDCLKVMGSDLRPEYGPERKVNPVSRRLADTRRAASKLGFQAQVSLEEGLARLVGWWRSEHLAQGPTRASSA